MCIIFANTYIMTFLIFALNQNGARRNDVFNGFPFSSANPTLITIDQIITLTKNILFFSFGPLEANATWWLR
jgi:hypothetical protein